MKLHPGWVLVVAPLLAGCLDRSIEPEATVPPGSGGTVPKAALTEAQETIRALRQELVTANDQEEELRIRLDQLRTDHTQQIVRFEAQVAQLAAQVAQLSEASETESPPPGEAMDLLLVGDGRRIPCRVLRLDDQGIFTVEMADGGTKKARARDLTGIEFGVSDTPPGAVAALAPPPVSPGSDATLALSPFWEIALPAGSQKTRDLQRLFTKFGTPRVDRSGGGTGDPLFKTVTYLQDAEEAVRALNLGERGRRLPVETPGLPRQSLFYYQFEGYWQDRFELLLLVVDMKDQVVAVQLLDEDPSRTFVGRYGSLGGSDWHLFDVVQARGKGRSESAVHYRLTRLNPTTVRLDSEYFNTSGESRDVVSLFIAQPLVDLVLYLIQKKY